jgi:hypothetical protein
MAPGETRLGPIAEGLSGRLEKPRPTRCLVKFCLPEPRSAIKTDLFADDHHRKKIDSLGDPLAEIESYIDFAALAAEVDRIAPRPVSPQGGRPPYPTETMVRILVLKRLYTL